MRTSYTFTLIALFLFAMGCGKKADRSRANSNLADSSGSVAQDTSRALAPGDTLGRGPWRWIATVTPAARIASPNPDVYTLEFLPDSTVRALLDCNRGSGRYHLDGHSMRIGPLAATRMMCPPGSMDATFGGNLNAVHSWSMEADTLQLNMVPESWMLLVR
jgi:heat shock protein HslJ